MSSNATTCAPSDTFCTIKENELEIIIVPVLLLGGTLITLVVLCFLRFCPKEKQPRTTSSQHYKSSSHRRTQSHNHRNNLAGIDAPPGINPLEHEVLPMTVQQVQQNGRSTHAAVLRSSSERQHGAFSHVIVLPQSLPRRPNDTVSLYRARMENRNVILRVLKETANSREKQDFLGFVSFVSGLGPHPDLPALLGVVSAQPPLTMVVEELQYGDLLGYLWRCRKDDAGLESSCDMTEKRIFIMARQVASAMEYLHSQRCVHGNVAARSVLVGADLTAKLWGLGSAYRRRTQAGSPGETEDMEMRKWQAPEVLARRGVSQSSDVWSFGILLYEMVTLGDPPFAEVMATELLQHLQRGRHLRRPASCSSSLFSVVKSCCQWSPHHRLSVPDLIRKLQAGEHSANGNTALRVAEPIDTERYLREAGYGESYNYAVL